MSNPMHWLVIVLTLASILGCWWLIAWSAKQGDPTKGAEDILDHVWDENLRERNQPLPRWWLILFYLTIVFSLGYLALYPGLGNFAGTLDWTQQRQYRAEVDAVEDVYAALYARLTALEYPELVENEEALAIGHRLFAANCTTCHGSDGGGAVGFPSLRDDEWLWGGDFAAIEHSITHGRTGVMPPWGPALGEQGIEQMVAYVKQLAGLNHDPAAAAGGKARWGMCLACHGAEGEGNPALGAPSLRDQVWLYGRSDEAIAESIGAGRAGQMPAQKDLLSAEKIKILTAYVKSLSR